MKKEDLVQEVKTFVDIKMFKTAEEALNQNNTIKTSNVIEKQNLKEDKVTLSILSSLLNNITFLFHISKDCIDCDKKYSYKRIKNIFIKEGIIFAKSVEDIIESNIKLNLGNVWVKILDFENNPEKLENYEYIIHNGSWWVVLPKHTDLNQINYTPINYKKT